MHPGYGGLDGTGSSALKASDARSRSSSVSSHDTWNSSSSDEVEAQGEDEPVHSAEAVPAALRPGRSSHPGQQWQMKGDELPASLRVGPSGTTNSQYGNSSQGQLHHSESQWWSEPDKGIHTEPGRPQKPFPHRDQVSLPSAPIQDSQQIWSNERLPPRPSAAPPLPPTASSADLLSFKDPSEELAGLSVSTPPDHLTIPASNVPASHGSRPKIQKELTGRSNGSLGSNAANPWQEDLDREERRLRDWQASVATDPATSFSKEAPAPSGHLGQGGPRWRRPACSRCRGSCAAGAACARCAAPRRPAASG